MARMWRERGNGIEKASGVRRSLRLQNQGNGRSKRAAW